MKDQQKRLWQKPEVIIISAAHDINGGTNPTLHEGGTSGGRHHISSVAHGGSATVSTSAYNKVHS